MTFKENIFYRYLCHAPLALAVERAAESRLYRRYPLRPPVLDMGCGEGLFAEMLFEERLDTGVDPDPREIQNARRRGRHRELIRTTGDQIPKPEGHFRTIVSNSVLEHIPDLRPVLKEIHRILHPEGFFFFTAPSEKFERFSLGHSILTALGMPRAAARFRKFYNSFWKHYHCYPLSEWITLLGDCGFQVHDAVAFCPRETCMLNDALAPLGFPGKILQRSHGRWVMWPKGRAVLMKPVARALAHCVKASGPCPNGGLVFLALSKCRTEK